MKRATFIMSALIAGVMTAGMAGQAVAMPNAPTWALQEGNSPSRLIPTLDRYHLDVDSRSRLQIASQLWSHGTDGSRMSALLKDEQGNVVARSDARGHNFVLTQSLEPGRYILDVHGTRLSGRKETTQRYYLTTELH